MWLDGVVTRLGVAWGWDGDGMGKVVIGGFGGEEDGDGIWGIVICSLA